MKATTNSTNIFRGLFSHWVVIIFAFFLNSNIIFGGNILNVQSIKISKDYPASFVIDLERNDIVTVKYSKVGGTADINQMLVQVIDLNQQEEVVVSSINRSGRDFLAEFEGKYRIDFIYNGPGGMFKQRFLNIKVDLDLDGFEGLEKGESMEILHSTSAVIEDTEAKALKLRYDLTEGDKITVSSQDSKAPFLKLKVTQLAKMFSVSGSTVISIPSDGVYSFNFYLDESDDNGSFLNLNLRDLLSNDDVLFRDLSIYRERAVDFSAMMTSNSGNGNTNSNNPSSAGEGAIDEQNDNMLKSFEEMLKSSNDAAADNTQNMVEVMEGFKDFLKEMNEKKNYVTTVYSVGNDMTMKLEPEFNFASSNENRKCELLSLPPSTFNIWFYWIGVGDEAQKAYEEHNANIQNSFKKSLDDAAAEYLYGKYTNTNVGRRNPTFPDENEYSNYLFEDAEYAIVDYYNMLKFKKGQKYKKLNQSFRNAQFITADHGISTLPTGDMDLYLCACNNNKATPVNIYFRYVTIDYEEKEF